MFISAVCWISKTFSEILQYNTYHKWMEGADRSSGIMLWIIKGMDLKFNCLQSDEATKESAHVITSYEWPTE